MKKIFHVACALALFSSIAFIVITCVAPLPKTGWFKIGYNISALAAGVSLVCVALCVDRWPRAEEKKNNGPLTVAEIKMLAVEYRQSGHPGCHTMNPPIKLRALIDLPQIFPAIRKGQIVRARQFCEVGKWNNHVRLKVGRWIPVEVFEIAKD